MAQYPTAIITLAAHSDGDTIFAADVNTPNAEIVAVETGLLNGFQHNLSPLTDNAKDLGDSTHAWKNLWTKGTTEFNGVVYTWPAADGTSNQVLSTNGSKVLAWASAAGTPIVDEFRLSLTTALSVTTADVTAATTLYLTPHVGRRMTIFDGSGTATILTSAEISIAVPASTSQMYDIFVYNNSGVLTLELLAWTNDTTRATAIIKTGALDAAGVWTKTGDTTRRYVGSFRTTTVSGQTEDSVTKRYLWNFYHRVKRPLQRYESTASWTYTTATVRQANGSTSNQVDVVVGVAEVALDVGLVVSTNNSTGSLLVSFGIGEDSTTTYTVGASIVTSAGDREASSVRLVKNPAVGRHFYAWNEWSTATGTSTWYGAVASVGSSITHGLSGWIEG